MKKIKSVQDWLPFFEFLEKGVIKLKNSSYIKILKIVPINYNLKSNLEKEAILNSYKNFLKSFNFDIQILIQSNKENLNQLISKINNQKEENQKIKNIANKYIEYIEKLNSERQFTAKRFFIIIKTKKTDNLEELEDQYLSIKELLSRCGNRVEEINSKNEIKEIINSFINRRINK